MKIKKHKNIKSVNIILVIIFIYSMFISLYVIRMRDNINEETTIYLSEVASRGANIIKTQIAGDFETIETIASMIGSHESLELKHTIETLENEVKRKNFKRMGIILPDGKAVLTEGIVADLSDREYFHQSLNGETALSGRLADKFGGNNINVYSTPIHGQYNEIMGVFFASHDTGVFKELLEVSTFGGAGYSYIIQSDGIPIVTSRHETSIKEFDNLFDLLSKAEISRGYTLDGMRKDMREGKTGRIVYTYEGIKKYLNYEPIGEGEWYITSIGPEAAISRQVNRTIETTLMVAIFTTAIFGGLLFYILLIQRKNKKILERMAFIDPLTGFYNWNRFDVVAREILKDNIHKEYAFIILDVNKFKVINDLFGHNKGSELLRHIARVLYNLIEEQEVFARDNSDHYVMLVHYQDEEELIKRIKAIERLVNVDEAYPISLAFGIYKITDRSLEINIMSDRADLARRTVKQKSDGSYAFYTDKIRNTLLIEKEIEDDMEKALVSKEFELYLQPQYSLLEECIVGAEALVRWNHTKKGLISPDEFIPIFERNGFIKKLDRYMYEEVCKMIERYSDIFCVQKSIPISVNFSRITLSKRGLIDELCRIVSRYHVDINTIKIELTETSMFNNKKRLIEIMMELRAKGFAIAVDDFGSGYSSLNILKEIPADILKLDKLFLDEAMDNKRGRDIIESIIHMAKKLNLVTIAEGVETIEQVKALRDMGCDIAQGYYYAKPMPIEQFIKLINAQR